MLFLRSSITYLVDCSLGLYFFFFVVFPFSNNVFVFWYFGPFMFLAVKLSFFYVMFFFGSSLTFMIAKQGETVTHFIMLLSVGSLTQGESYV